MNDSISESEIKGLRKLPRRLDELDKAEQINPMLFANSNCGSHGEDLQKSLPAQSLRPDSGVKADSASKTSGFAAGQLEVNELEVRDSRGRMRKHDSEKAKVVSLRLYESEIEAFPKFQVNTTADKVREMMDSYHNNRYRERAQVRELFRRIDGLYKLSQSLWKPSESEEEAPSLITADARRFLSRFHELEKLMDLMHIQYSTIKKYLGREETRRLSVVFSHRASLLDVLGMDSLRQVGVYLD